MKNVIEQLMPVVLVYINGRSKAKQSRYPERYIIKKICRYEDEGRRTHRYTTMMTKYDVCELYILKRDS